MNENSIDLIFRRKILPTFDSYEDHTEPVMGPFFWRLKNINRQLSKICLSQRDSLYTSLLPWIDTPIGQGLDLAIQADQATK